MNTSQRIGLIVALTAMTVGLATVLAGDLKLGVFLLVVGTASLLSWSLQKRRDRGGNELDALTGDAQHHYLAFFGLAWLILGAGSIVWGLLDGGGIDKALLLLFGTVALFVAGTSAVQWLKLG